MKVIKPLGEAGHLLTPHSSDLYSHTVAKIVKHVIRWDIFLYVLSPSYLVSEDCAQEFNAALTNNLPMIALLYKDSDTYPASYLPHQRIDFRYESRFEESFKQLVQVIAEIRAWRSPSPQPTGEALTIRLLPPNSTSPEEVPATPELARLLAKATRINKAFEEKFDLSFSSMLLAFLASDDPLSRWFARYVKDAGIAIDELLKARGIGRAIFDAIAARPLDETELSTLDRPRRRTESANNLVQAAREIALGLPVDTRHLMGAYIYRPAGHEKDLEGLRFNREAWSNAFLGQIQKLHPQKLEGWKDLHRSIFKTEPSPVEEIEGPSTHIASDMWTLNDTLGYRAYAH
ncbi:MAG: TIR domain-containing protein, partial [Acidobacteria bacterium]|nr:TIR domain-containing protein [Acidobacteriota bacterium]